jgi:hypothetical protein
MGTISVKAPRSYLEKKEAADENRKFHRQGLSPDAPPEQIEAARAWDPDEEADKGNTIKKAYIDDLLMVDAQQSSRMPPFVRSELEKAAYREACRRCYEVEKVMGACLQNKLWTAWKCEKERDAYFACIDSYEKSPELMNDLRWKYNLGVFHGEIVSRKRLMNHLWDEYFPDRSLEHPWAAD